LTNLLAFKYCLSWWCSIRTFNEYRGSSTWYWNSFRARY